MWLLSGLWSERLKADIWVPVVPYSNKVLIKFCCMQWPKIFPSSKVDRMGEFLRKKSRSRKISIKDKCSCKITWCCFIKKVECYAICYGIFCDYWPILIFKAFKILYEKSWLMYYLSNSHWFMEFNHKIQHNSFSF